MSRFDLDIVQPVRHNFSGFYCKNCGGRVLQDEIWTEIDPNTKAGSVKIDLVCILCAKRHTCGLKEYKKLLKNIEQIIARKKIAKDNQEPLLSESR